MLASVDQREGPRVRNHRSGFIPSPNEAGVVAQGDTPVVTDSDDWGALANHGARSNSADGDAADLAKFAHPKPVS